MNTPALQRFGKKLGLVHKGEIRLMLKIEAFNPDGTHAQTARFRHFQWIPLKKDAVEIHPDISVKALTQFIMGNIFDNGASNSITDTGNTSRTVNANTATSAPFIVAGTTGTAPTWADFALGDGTTNTNYHANSNYAQSATIGAASSTGGNSGATQPGFSATATITNGSGSNITYKEVGFAITANDSGATARYFMIAHDQVNAGTGYTVSPSGTLAVTYYCANT